MSHFRNSVQVRTINTDPAYEDIGGQAGYNPMRQWQLEAYNLLAASDKPNGIINAPTGSGKTNAIASVVYGKLVANPEMKAVILVPEVLIGSGFGRHIKFQMPDGTNVDWLLPEDNNLCGDTNLGTINRTLDFLGDNVLQDWKERVLVCTNQTFVGAFKRMEENGSLDLLNDLFIVFDEAHHLQASDEYSDSERASNVANSLGRVMLRSHERNNSMLLVTATHFRGDKKSIMPSEIEQTFERYNLPYDRWMPQMNHLRSFSYDYLFGKMEDGYIQDMDLAVGRLLDEGYRKLVLYIPHRQTALGRNVVKEDEVEGIVSILARRTGSTSRIVRDDGVIELVHPDGVYRVLDLVTVEGREKRRRFFANGGISDNRDAIDCIIALQMMREGADWAYADGMVITGEKNSLNDLIQRVGRVLRDKEGKTRAKVVQLLPFSLQDLPADELNKNLNGRFKALAVSLLMEAVLCPPSLATRQSPERSPLDEGGVEVDFDPDPVTENLQRGNDLLVQNLDMNEQEEIRSSLYRDYLAEAERQRGVNGQYDNELIQSIFPEICRRRLEPILAERGVTLTQDDYEAIATAVIYPVQIRDSLSRAEELGINTDDIDWNVVHRVIRDGQTDPVEFMLEWASDSIDAQALASLRQVLVRKEFESNTDTTALCQYITDNISLPRKNTPLYNHLCNRRSARSGSKNFTWYPSDQAIAESFGFGRLFNPRPGATSTEDAYRAILTEGPAVFTAEEASNRNTRTLCEWIRDNRAVPPKTEVRLCSSLRNGRRAFANHQAGKSGTVWYPSDQAIVESFGFGRLFNPRPNARTAEDAYRAILTEGPAVFTPEEASNHDIRTLCEWIRDNRAVPPKTEVRLYNSLSNARRALANDEAGRPGTVWYPSDQAIAESFGFGRLFNPRPCGSLAEDAYRAILTEGAAVHTPEEASNHATRTLCEWIRDNKAVPPKTEVRLYNSLSARRRVLTNHQAGGLATGRGHWYPSDQAIAESFGFERLFNPRPGARTAEDAYRAILTEGPAVFTAEEASNHDTRTLCEWIRDNRAVPPKTEVRLYNSLSTGRRALANYQAGRPARGSGHWFPSDQAIAESFGFGRLFNPRPGARTAEDAYRAILTEGAAVHTPEEASNHATRTLCEWIRDNKAVPPKTEVRLYNSLSARRRVLTNHQAGKSGTAWYPSDQAIAESFGFERLFNPRPGARTAEQAYISILSDVNQAF